MQSAVHGAATRVRSSLTAAARRDAVRGWCPGTRTSAVGAETSHQASARQDTNNGIRADAQPPPTGKEPEPQRRASRRSPTRFDSSRLWSARINRTLSLLGVLARLSPSSSAVAAADCTAYSKQNMASAAAVYDQIRCRPDAALF